MPPLTCYSLVRHFRKGDLVDALGQLHRVADIVADEHAAFRVASCLASASATAAVMAFEGVPFTIRMPRPLLYVPLQPLKSTCIC